MKRTSEPDFRFFMQQIIDILEWLEIEYMRDIAAMLINLGDELDFDYISSWAATIGAADIWRELLAEYRARQTKGMTDES